MKAHYKGHDIDIARLAPFGYEVSIHQGGDVVHVIECTLAMAGLRRAMNWLNRND